MGATTTTPLPDRAATRGRAAMPGARTPSSLVTRMRTAPPCHAGGMHELVPRAGRRNGSSGYHTDAHQGVVDEEPHAETSSCPPSSVGGPARDRVRPPTGRRHRGGWGTALLYRRRRRRARWLRGKRDVRGWAGTGARPVAQPARRRALFL